MDIEECHDTINQPRKPTNEVSIKLRTSKNNKENIGQLDSVVPWTKSVYVRTWGCSHNNSDSEYMSGLLSKAGFPVVKNKEDADVWLLNSCTVKTPSETTFMNQIEEAKGKGKNVVVAGCVSQAAPNEPYLKDISIIGVKQIDQVVNVVEETIKGNTVRLLSHKRKDAPLSAPKIRKNDLIEILAINSGCLNNCTYCKTKLARGDLVSYPLEELVQTAKNAFEVDGCKELWLTSEDLGAYGRDIGLVLPDLLKELIKVIPEDCMMRLGMTNPPYILDHLDEIAEILNHPRVYSFLHIPVQAGSDSVLGEMKREYTREHFCQIVDYMKEHVPNIYIATDFICAFPTETEEDFEESMDLVKKYKFPSLYINQFYPRSGTPAARLKKINTIEAKRRTGAMTDLFNTYSRYDESRIGNIERVLVCETATDKIHLVGHNKTYEHILVPYKEDLLGKWVEVEIVEISKFHMKGKFIDNNNNNSVTKECNKIEKGTKPWFASFVIYIAILLLAILLKYFDIL
uniref:tRNA-t(6)A37 methylthiotransferase n=1 Tax=Parastrongyloides trichosuri TaxID=131310 RepID=A0A0N4ZES2_PARTI